MWEKGNNQGDSQTRDGSPRAMKTMYSGSIDSLDGEDVIVGEKDMEGVFSNKYNYNFDQFC